MAKLSSDMCSVLTKTSLENLNRRRIFTVVDVLQEEPGKLASISNLKFNDIVILRQTLVANYSPFPRQGVDAYNELCSKNTIISSGIRSLDNLLGGGFLTGNVYEICGLSGSGKTQLCLTVATNVAVRMKSVVHFVDTKMDFSGKRVHSMLEAKGANDEEIGTTMEKILVTRTHDFNELYSFLYHLKNQLVREPGSVSLIIIESLPAVFLQFMGSRKMDSLGLMNCLASLIKYIAHEQYVSIILVNLATMWVEEESSPLPDGDSQALAMVPHVDVKPVLGKYWTHVPNTRLYIEKSGFGYARKISVIKSTHLPVGTSCNVSVMNDGVR